MVGKPIMDIKMAESVISAGEIVISARVSHHLNANEYLIDVLPDNVHAKILGVGPNWRNIQRHYEAKATPMDSLSILSGQWGASDELSTHSDKKEPSTQGEDDLFALRIANDQYALRPAVNHAARRNIKDELRKFIIAPVMQGIQANEPIEYLTEIRQVCILFINIKVAANLSVKANIDIANEVYLSICHEVKGKYGCVNKISNFDKDLMLLVIFGLRGFKHELESQMALTCAMSCYEKVARMSNISGVATAVTTGKCYCGAFGHALRREYTVIGGIVNKAARLMVAYPNKVTCDRETFLHSKLEPRNFVLQQPKLLKGIPNPGPIYQFKGIEESSRALSEIMNLPLLGRDQEIELFRMLYKKAKKLIDSKSREPFYSMLLYKGTFRQGKTRLLEEIMYLTRENRYAKKYWFWSYDNNIPYKAIKKIFYKFFRIRLKANESRKQKAILPFLNNAKITPSDACFLNIAFDVNFPITSKFTNMSNAEKYKTLQQLFKRLCRSIFNNFWLLLMDDVQFMDDESWLLLNILIEEQLVFIVGTLGVEMVSPLVGELHVNAKIKVAELKAIDKWYHVGLACQMLQVGGIPPELEKTIQMKSSGNPGWVESFLVSTLQSGGLGLVEMTREKAYADGIVIPPLYAVMRLSNEETKLWIEIMEERLTSVTDDRLGTRWKMFVDSCRESFPDLSVAREFDTIAKKSEVLKICVLNEDFNLADVDPELAIDVIILKTFDALTSYEQLLLKCSSVLGDVFPRNMLIYIMSSSAIRTTALAVKKLFEIHVLSCAKGNFIEGGLDFHERLNNPNENLSVKCECRGLIIDDSCQDLPKYALCGYMRFRSSEFREITYNLLTENQKRDLHEKAIRYLEKDARRCRACGSGYFTRQLGTGRLDHTLRMKRKEPKRSLSIESPSIQEGMAATKFLTRYSFISLDSLQSSFTGSNPFKWKDSGRLKDQSVLSGSQDHMLSTISKEIGMKAVRKLKDNFNLVRSFSASDFSQCTCLQVLNTLYSDLIDHCKGAGHAEKILSVTAEYAYVCIENNNAPYAIKILEEALELLEGPLKDQIELDWMVDLRKGKLYTILGQARMEIDDDQALAYFKEALNRYGLKYPKTVGGRNLLKHILKLKHKLKYTLGYNAFRRNVDDTVKEYNNNLSECLGCLCKYYMKKNRLMEAELMAIWSLSKAVTTESDFEKLCYAYGNAIMTETMLNHFKFAEILEIYSLKNCHMKKSYVELDELKSVAYLYYTISLRRVIRGEIEKFLHIGHLLWKLAASCRCENIVFLTLPLIAYVILTKRQIAECVHVIQEIRYVVENDVDNSEKCWYYALCMLVHLETSLSVEAPSECLRFVQEDSMETAGRDSEGKKQLLACVWLREIRLENWESAVVWQKFVWNFCLKRTGESLANCVTSLYLLEGLIIYLCHKLDRKNMKCVNKAINKITEIIERLDKESKYNKFIQPRLLHMKAYYKLVRFNDYKGALKMMLKAKINAEANLNDLEMDYLRHTEKAWLKKLHREEMDFWRDHADDLNQISVGDPDFLEKIHHFTLPLPIYA
ncbi:unnamed protein product [Phyllotreta striolata]|uniref:Adenylate cyclase type 10 n=1 Tax=Phyllotreta striolata TaxID=444603 RepID=A0A9N9TDI5_PHYSR|nr:unnamed protein product [Phyllotreta striolata]